MKFIVENKILFVILFVILLCTSCSYEKNNSGIVVPSYPGKEEIINKMYTYDDSFDSKFLSYVYDEYGYQSLLDIISYSEKDGYDTKLWHKATGNSYIVLQDYYNNVYEKSSNVRVIESDDNINLSFVGDISLADDWEIIPYYDSRKKGVYGILGQEVVDMMREADIMVANNEFTVSNGGSKLPNKYYTFRAKPERLSIYDEMGVDIVSIANNHAYDYGEDAFLDTLKYLKDYDIPYVGGGKNRKEATSPYYFVANGYKIAFVAATRAEKYILTPEATKNSSGVFRAYDPSLLIKTIKKAKKSSDFVVVLIHWGKEDSHELEDVQLTTGKKYINAGADLVVGSHAHVLQGMEFYKNKLIAHNLGDFIFNRENKDTGILNVTIDDNGNMSYEFVPCRQKNFKTTMLSGNGKNRVIKNMRGYSINTIFDDNGSFSAKD